VEKVLLSTMRWVIRVILIVGRRSRWSTDLFSHFENPLGNVDAFRLQLLFGHLEFVLRNLEMVGGSE
jgi:hypothetical protein